MGNEVHMHVEDRLNVNLNLALSPKTESDIERLARDIHGTKDDVFTWALALLSLAVDAKKQGKRLAIVDEQGHVETDIGL